MVLSILDWVIIVGYLFDVLWWFWTGAVSAVVLWWLVMLLGVGITGPLELARMARGLNRSSDDGDESSPAMNLAANHPPRDPMK